jgi:hypothetical protein
MVEKREPPFKLDMPFAEAQSGSIFKISFAMAS